MLHYDNFTNTAKTGSGFYPPSFLGASPSWEYSPWTLWDCGSNREYLQRLLFLLREKGFTPLIRDASHLGFPSYFILVPGMSEIYERSRLRLRDVNAITKTRMSFRHFPDLNEEEETLLLRMIQFKQGSIIENGLDIISGLFLKGELFTSERVGAYLALKAEKYALAARLFDRASACVRDGKDRRHLACMAEYARVLGAGADRENALSATAFLFGREAAERVKEETENPADMLKKVFPRLNCYDCKNCPIAGLHCEYPAAAEILKKLDRAMAQSSVSQEALLEKLKGLAAQS